MKFSGREATLLSLLAQRPDPKDREVRQILQELTGEALAVARALLNLEPNPEPKVRDAAIGLRKWARSLSAP